MERGLLSEKALAAHYDDVIWFYLFQDFSKSKEDRAAERIAIRFGISAWPQHFLVDPHELEVLADTGRSFETFSRAVQSSRVRQNAVVPTLTAYDEADALAEKIESTNDLALAKKHRDHEDLVVRFRALEVIADKEPKILVDEAETFLAVSHDQTRNLVAAALAEKGTTKAARALEDVVRDPKQSKNPNVVRTNCVKALARCGTAESIAVIDPHATSGAWRNGLTAVSIDSITAIAERDPKAKAAAIDVLVRALPRPPAEQDAEVQKTEMKMCLGLVRRVVQALEKLTKKRASIPTDYDEAARQKLMKAFD